MSRRLSLILIGAAATLVLGTAAWAFWANIGAGAAIVTTATFSPPSNPVASAPVNSATVTISWSEATVSGGQAASGYYVTRIRSSDSVVFPACGTSTTATIVTLSCSDLDVTDGDYQYRVTATYESWTAVSALSNTTTVVNDTTLPSVQVTSITPTPNGNGYVNSTPVVVVLSAAAGSGISSVTYQLDSAVPVTVDAATASISVAGNGLHTLTFSAEDNTGNVSPTSTVLIRIDTVPPDAPSAPRLTTASDTGISSVDAITKVTAPVFTGTAEDGATVALYDGSTLVGSGVASGGVYTISSRTLTPGSHSITAQVTDLAGNLGPASSPTAVMIDTNAPSAPPAPTLTAASDSGTSSSDRITNVTTPSFTGTAEDGATVTLYNAGTAVGSAISTGGTYDVTSSTLTAGTKSITVKATDVAGNVGAASTVTSVVIDTTAPAKPGTPVLAAASDSGRSSTDRITKVTTPTFTGTVSATSIVTLYDGTTAIGSAYTATTSFSIVSTTLTNGSHSITARATDIAGNLGLPSAAIPVTVDTIAPVPSAAPLLSATSDSGRSSTDRITNKTTPVFTGTNETRAIVVLYDGSTQVGTVTTTRTSYSVATSTLAPGSHTLTITLTDIAGNLSTASAGTVITIDTTAPAAPSKPVLALASDTGTSNVDAITRSTTLVYTGTAEDGATVALLDAATVTGTAVTATGGTYSATTGTLVSGSHAISARATDVAGNVGVTSASASVTVDTVVPTLTLNQATDQADPTSATPVVFTAVFSETVVGLNSSDVTYSGTAGVTTTTITGAGRTYDIAASGMTKTGTVLPAIAANTVTDIAGNANTVAVSTDRTVTYVDNTAPTVVISSFTAGPSRTVTVSGTAGQAAGDNVTVTVVLCTTNAYPCTAPNTKATLSGVSVNPTTGGWTVTSAALGATASVYARATQTDLTLNTGVSNVRGPLALP